MDTQADAPSTTPSVQVVGNAFVDQYYHILHHSPELVYKFYQESSIISRPEQEGEMTSVTTLKGIHEKICSFDYTNYKAEIMTADAQESYKDGVIVLVTGCLTGKDKLRRKFSQSFFLAPQEKGYFVLNDVFRYVGDSELSETDDGADNDQSASLISEPPRAIDPPVPDHTAIREEGVQNVEEESQKPMDNERPITNENKEVDPKLQPVESRVSAGVEPLSSTVPEDAPKKSYASIVSSQTKKGVSGPMKLYVPANTVRVTPTKSEKKADSLAVQPPSEASGPIASSSIDSPDSGNAQDEGVGYSIYVKNLPLNATASQLELEFKKFGPIKQGGVQVRSTKDSGFCFGFVEFLSPSSMNNAIQASPITIGDRQAAVEMKRTSARVGGGRGRFPLVRGGFRNDFRGRGSFNGGRGYGRNDFGPRSEYVARGEHPIRGRGLGGRSGEVYRQQGRGRGGGQRSGPSQNAVST